MKLSHIISRDTEPYGNIALEEFLLTHVEEEECILYLWQNRKTVVIGYNQNAWKECRTEILERDGGHLARRLSGGGAVFHDMGNLNFTFLVRKKYYDVAKQSQVILKAVQSFGIPAVCTGRNDLTADGRKFSGNAFYQTGDFCYHHGTILIRTDKEAMSRYLSVSREKLVSKGVDSVRSRVVNLEEYVPDLTVEQLEQALIRSFESVYEGKSEAFAVKRLDRTLLEEGRARFASWQWCYGRKIPFQYEISGKFSWGEALVQLQVSEGIIHQAVIWSDAMDAEAPGQITGMFEGTAYAREQLLGKIHESGWSGRKLQMAEDLVALITGDGNQSRDF